MRSLTILTLLIVVSGCGTTASPEASIIGSWKLMGMSPERVSVDRVTVSDLMTGTMNFKDDGTFDGEVVYPRMPDKNLRVSGTYTVHNGTLTIENQTNNSTTRSKLSFEQNFMIATPIDPKGVIAYYRRIE